MLFLLLTSIVALTISKYNLQSEYDATRGPTLAQIERALDRANDKLDIELAGMLEHLHELSSGGPSGHRVDSEMEAKFAALEACGECASYPCRCSRRSP